MNEDEVGPWSEMDAITLENVDAGLLGSSGTYHSDVMISTETSLPGYDQTSQTSEQTAEQPIEQPQATSEQQQEEWVPGQYNSGDVAYNYLMNEAGQGVSGSSGGYTRGYSSSSYRGGSSSSYMPRVYSNSRSVSADRASTMYSKQPRDANYSYLRPSFETRGSRSAYER